MEFPAPERLSILEGLMQAPLFAIVLIIAWIALSAFAISATSRGIAVVLIILSGFLFAAFGVGAATDESYARYVADTKELITQTNSQVFLSEDSDITSRENTPRDISLITKDNGDILSCQMILFSGDYKITCEDPATNNKMVSVDEALAAL